MPQETPVLFLCPSREIDTTRPILGVSLTERAACVIGRYYGITTVYAPHLSEDRLFRGIHLKTKNPPLTGPLILADPLLLFDGRLLRNLSVNFTSPAVACDPAALEPIGLALIDAASLSEEFLEAPWFSLRELISRRQDARVAVIEARYFVIAHAADIAGAENFLLRSLAHTGDDLFERNLTRPLSRLVTAWSASLRIPPDLWSVLVLLCGFLSAAGMLLFSSVESLFFPALIALAALFSAVDGETARLLFRTSPRGGILNYYSSRLALWLYFLAVTILFRDAGFLFFSGVIFLFAYPLLVIRYDRHRHRGKERPAAPWRRIERMARRHFSIHAVAFCTLAAALFGILRITLILALPLMAAGSLLALHEAISTRMERRSRP